MKTRLLLSLRACISAGLAALLAVASAQAPPKKTDPPKKEAPPKKVEPGEKEDPAKKVEPKKDDKPADPASSDKPPAIPDVPLDDPAGMFDRAEAAFAKGEWLTAASNYKGLLTIGKKTRPDKDLEPLYFVIGVCLFNLPNYDEALKAFTEYTQKYPTGPMVPQVNLAIARIFRAQKKWPEAVKQYKPLVNVPVLKDDVLIELADAYKENQEKDKGIVLLETALAPGLKTPAEVRAALYLVDLYQEDKPEKGVALLEKVKMSVGARPLVSEINYAALKLADSLMGAQKFEEALRAYQNLRKKKEVIDTLKNLEGDYQRLISSLSLRIGSRHPDAAANLQKLDRVKLYQAQAKAMITNLEKAASYDAVVFYRMGRCFAALERYWEARLAFEYVRESFPNFEDAPTALYALAYCYYNLAPLVPEEDNLKMGEKAQALCREFLSNPTYREREESSQVSEMLITLATRTKDPVKINKVYEEVMELIKDSPNRTRFLAQQVQNYLEQYDFDKARDAADKFLSDAPAEDPMREPVEYMHALTWFFKNDYDGAIEHIGGFIAKYPNSPYMPDAKYRLAFLLKGEELAKKAKRRKGTPRFRNVIETAETQIIKPYPDTPSAADAYALIGDCYKEMTGEEIADAGLTREQVEIYTANAYIEAIKRSKSDLVAEYSLTQAAPLLKSQNRWEERRAMYETFLKAYPDHRLSLSAVGEICKSIERASETVFGKELAAAEKAKSEAEQTKIVADVIKAEAEVKKYLDLRQNAKDEGRTKSREYLAATIKENINNPQKEGVEELMQQLALMAVPKRKAAPAPPAVAPAPAPAGTAVSTAAAPPVVKRPEPPSVAEQGKAAEAELDRLLQAGTELTNIGKARLLYVKTQLYKYMESRAPKKRDEKGKYIEDTSPKRSDELMKQLLSQYKPADYSSALLAMVGDHFLHNGDKESAAACFNRLLQFFPKSVFLDWACVGLGDIALAAKDYEGALKKYNMATEEYIGSKYGEAVLGRARVQFYTDKLEEAEKSLKEVTGDKSYPPEPKAEATWLLGEIKFKQKALPDAYNFFQRLYVSFGKFPAWVIKGYLRAGETKEALSKFEDAKAVYKEVIDNPKSPERFKGLPDYEALKNNYRKLGP